MYAGGDDNCENRGILYLPGGSDAFGVSIHSGNTACLLYCAGIGQIYMQTGSNNRLFAAYGRSFWVSAVRWNRSPLLDDGWLYGDSGRMDLAQI